MDYDYLPFIGHLIDSEFDVALRIGHLPDSNLVARRLAGFRTQVFASPTYIERHGEPLHPDDLQHHRTLSFSKFRRNNGYCWPLSDGGRTQEFRIDPLLVTNDPGPLTGALLCGEGLMLSSDLTIKPYVEQGLALRAGGLDRPADGAQRGVPARPRAVAEGACVYDADAIAA